jgi:hypothetical protein
MITRQAVASSDDHGKVFICSELERASYSIKHVDLLSENIMKQRNESANGGKESNISRTKELDGIQRSVRQKSQQLMIALIGELQKFASSLIPADTDALAKFSSVAFAHIVRALLLLDRGDVLESCCEQVVLPLAKSMLTQGRVDGTGGRGSYFGLESTLIDLVQQLKTLLGLVVDVVEQQLTSTMSKSSCDVVVKGIFLPVASLLSERFPSMFTIAIADNFARCFLAYDRFRSAIRTIPQEASSIESVSQRLLRSQIVIQIDDKWRMDVYFHLRCQELYAEVDRACEAVHLGGVTKEVVFAHENSNALSVIIHKQDYHLPIIAFFVMQLLRCFDPMVMLRPLRLRFLQVGLRLLRRLEAQVCILADITSTRFNKAKLQLMQPQQLTSPSSTSPMLTAADESARSSPPPKAAALPSASATPLSANSNAMDTPGSGTSVTAKAPATAAALSSPPITADELVFLFVDLTMCCDWLSSTFLPTLLSLWEAKPLPAVELFVANESKMLRELALSLWQKTCNMVTADCKRNLSGVRVIAGKYRMTNKPPPDAPSPYVETILQPLR